MLHGCGDCLQLFHYHFQSRVIEPIYAHNLHAQVHLLQEVQRPSDPSPLPATLLPQAAEVWRGVAAQQVIVSQFHAQVAATLTTLGT